MANSKSKKTTKKNTKKSVNETRSHQNIIDSVGGVDTNFKKIIIVVGSIIIIFAVFYFITVYVTENSTPDYSKNLTTTDGTISYSEIMAGRSFSMPEKDYYVLFYDRSNSDVLTALSGSISDYRSKDDNLALYTVDMSNAINKKYANETSNWSPSSVSELAINGPTLIHFTDGVVVEYFEGETDIVNQLS